MSIQVFLSYAQEDKSLVDRLIEHLNPLKREGLIAVWYDQQVTAGIEWRQAVKEHLHSADLVLLLISPAFLSSDYCYSEEMTQALARHDAGNARVIPLLLRPVDWRNTPIGSLRALPSNATPVALWSNRDQAFYDIAIGVREVVEELLVIREIDSQANKNAVMSPKQVDNRDEDAIARVDAINRQRIPERKYILVSSAPEDEDKTISIVSRIKYSSNFRDIQWVYQINLKSDLRLRNVLKRAFAILLIISPHSRDSALVEKAIQFGRAHECPICPMWFAGSSLERCLPKSAINLELVDCRQARDDDVFVDVWPIARSLAQTLANRSKNHIYLRAEYGSWNLPGYAVIEFSRQNTMAVKYNLYPSFGLFLEDIYVKYLADRYDPFTYGEKWLLARDIPVAYSSRYSSYTLFAHSWNWLFRSNKDRKDIRLRDFRASPERFGIRVDTQWRIIENLPNTLFGIATNSDMVASIFASTSPTVKERGGFIEALRKSQEARLWQGTTYWGWDRGRNETVTIRAVPPEAVNPDVYKFLFIFSISRFGGFLPGKNLEEDPESTEEKIIKGQEDQIDFIKSEICLINNDRIKVALEGYIRSITFINEKTKELRKYLGINKRNIEEMNVRIAMFFFLGDNIKKAMAMDSLENYQKNVDEIDGMITRLERRKERLVSMSLKRVETLKNNIPESVTQQQELCMTMMEESAYWHIKDGGIPLEYEYFYQETLPGSRSFSSYQHRCIFVID